MSSESREYEELPAQSYMARISNLPGLAAINGLVSSFPVLKMFTSNSLPVLVARDAKKKRSQLEESFVNERLEAVREFNEKHLQPRKKD
ncbi:uncharacterized protein LODBEIA_P24300 [Lodderomyces beijingensis]|uniref:Uncharacterized protein n=1 Tax=Lodderomyces beijingensis TaxID=1775926 RepID=A0ABP0ZMT3_9ASCO